MATNNYTATNGNGVQYALTYNSLFGTYTLVRTFPTGGGSTSTISGIPAANVVTTSGNTFTIASALVGSTYVIPPGVTGTVNVTIALATLVPNTVYVGGTATISSTASVLSGMTVYVDGGAASVSNGTLAGALSNLTVYLDNGGSFGNGSAVATVLNGTTINFGLNGGTFIVNAGNQVINLSSTTINGFTNGTDHLQFLNVAGTINHYSITTVGSTQQIVLYGANNTALATATVAGTPFATGTVYQGQSGPLTISASGSTVTVSAATSIFTCFLAGTRILTPLGEIEIEKLSAGDLVLTADGRAVPIVWVGINAISTAFVAPEHVLPVRIAAGAFAENVPSRDLLVSPDHAFYFEGSLVPIQLLINNMSICQMPHAGPIVYYHIELEPHDLIIAEGAVTESYLDIGSQVRHAADGVSWLFPLPDPKTWDDACAPLLLSGPVLTEIRQGLAMRAQHLIGESLLAPAA